MNNSVLFQWMMAYGLKMNENRLSDIVWSLCQVDRGFLEFFFKFAFGEEAKGVIVYFSEREVPQEGGRNDFVFYTNQGEYILESKINDTVIKADSYLVDVNMDSKRIRYILADDTNKYAYGWKIENDRITNEKDQLSFAYILWEDFANKLLNKERKEWNLLGALIIQTLYQKEIKIKDVFENFNFSEPHEVYIVQHEKFLPRKIKIFADKQLEDKWNEGNDYGYFINESKSIWYGSVYTPTDSEGAILVLAIKEDVFKYRFKSPNFKHKGFEYLIPIGRINCIEGWYYFKLTNRDKVEQARKELEDFVSEKY